MSDDYPTDWETKVRFMRAVGATSAEWAEVAQQPVENSMGIAGPRTCSVTALRSITLGPQPSAPDSKDEPTQPANDRDKIDQARRDERRRVALAASPALVKRLDSAD